MTRRYYQLLDFAQSTWSRFRQTEVGKATIWLAPRLVKASWLLVKLSMIFMTVFIIGTYGLMLFVLLVCTGNGKAAISSFTKITVVIIGLFAAGRLMANKPEVGAALKAAVAKP